MNAIDSRFFRKRRSKALRLMFGTALGVCLPCVVFAAEASLQKVSVPASAAKEKQTSKLMFISPRSAAIVDAAAVKVELRVSRDADFNTLQVRLNRVDLSNRLKRTNCATDYCLEVATLTSADTLTAGKNVLQASVEVGRRRTSAKARFIWEGNGLGAAPPPLLPASVNFFTVNPGGQTGTAPWVTINNSSFPVYGSDPTTQPSACTTAMQLIVLDRAQLTQSSYQCLDSEAALETALKVVTSGQLAILGTMPQQVVPSGFNTTAIGGTDYSDSKKFPYASYPRGYMAVGVGGADPGQPGQATEDYFVPYDAAVNPNPWAPVMTGLLIEQSNKYSFHPTGPHTYLVNPGSSTGGASILIDPPYIDPDSTDPLPAAGTTYVPPSGVTNGLWVLVLDRINLSPITSCSKNDVGATVCGNAYKTGEVGGGPDQLSLATYLGTLTDRNLVFITSIGQPFSNVSVTGSGSPDDQLTSAIAALGGSEYDVTSLYYDKSPNEANGNYTLVTVPHATGYNTSVNGKAVVSTSLNSQLKQTGYVSGILAKDSHFMYAPAVSGQENVTSAAAGTHTNYSFYTVSWETTTPWPNMDTDGKIAAYQYISNFVKTGTTDLRSLYTGGELADLLSKETNSPSSAPYVSTYNNVAISEAEFSAVQAQLATELSYLGQVDSQMQSSGDASYASLFSDNGAYTQALLAAATSVQSSALAPSSSTKATVNYSNILNTAAAVLSLFAGGDEGLSKSFGLISGMMWTASGLAVPNAFGDSTKPAIPNPEYSFTFTLSTLADNAPNLSEGFDVSLDNIYSDWGKLSAAYQHTLPNHDWYTRDMTTLANAKSLIQAAYTESFYLQLAPAFYSADAFQGTSANSAADLGNKWDRCGLGECDYICEYVYQEFAPPAGSSAVFQVHPGSNDIYILGGEIAAADGTTPPHTTYPGGQQDIFNTITNTYGLPLRELLSVNGPFAHRPNGPWGDHPEPCTGNNGVTVASTGLGSGGDSAHSACSARRTPTFAVSFR